MKNSLLISSVATIVLIGNLAAASPMGGKDGMRGEHGPKIDFEQVDANKDGKITRSEAQAAAQARFAIADTDGDGTLSADEMVAAAQKQGGAEAEKRHARMLKWRDANGDGKLAFDEMGGDRMAQMIERADADGDGAVSKDELAQARGKTGRHGKDKADGWGQKHKRGQANE